MTERFTDRTGLLIGEEGIASLRGARVLVFGLGGVGSYVVEALCRCGVGGLAIVDRDVVAVSNINRQLIALNSTVGQKKTEVCKKRLLDINPNLEIECFFMSFDERTADEIDFSKYDYVVDAIDTLPSKVEIIKRAKLADVRVISCMGTGFKLDPRRLMIDDIAATSICPLAKLMRKALKTEGIKDVKVLYSTEPPILTNRDGGESANTPVPICQNFDQKISVESPPSLNECDGNSYEKASTEGGYYQECHTKAKAKTIASIAFVPAVAGLLIASEVIKDLLK